MATMLPLPNRTASSVRRLATACGLAAAALLAGGCEVSDFLDPSNVVDPSKRNQLENGKASPVVSVILDDLDLGVTPPDEAFADARDVQAGDMAVISEDYIIGAADQLRVTINDYPVPGGQFVDAFEVSSTGSINLPDVDEVVVEGLTESEAADAIEEAFVDRQIFVDGAARINVLAFTKQNRTFTIIGNAVGRANRYVITQPNFRLLDAMALSGAVTSAEVLTEYAYIIRRQPSDGGPAGERAQPRRNNGGQAVPPGDNDQLSPRGDAGDINDAEPMLSDEWAPVFAQAEGTAGGGSDSFSFEPPTEPQDVEVLRVPVQELLSGQLKFNIVVRPGDTIVMNADVGGVYYVGGYAAVTGTYQLSPQNPVTLKRAIISARGLSPVAIPSRTQLIRKMGDQDVFVRVDLKKIFSGEAPDLYVKPGDMIMVGTNFPAPFLAALRNGFRVSYGFGFLYDRNFARDRNDNNNF